MKIFPLTCCVYFLLLSFASGVFADDKKLSVTIYNNDLAFVQEKRTIDVVAGISRIELKGVSAQIRPETVAFSAPGVVIVEQNFDFDLLTPAQLMEKAVGRQVQIVRINPGSGAEVKETATVLSVNSGVVLRIGDRIEVLNSTAIPTRVIFDRIPENLRATPTLSITVDAASAGPRGASLSYLTGGLSWQADYVALFDEKSSKLDLQGWITLGNHSGTTFENVEAQLVAGNINSTRASLSGNGGRTGHGSSTGAQNGGSPFADYYLYTLPRTTTIANEQTKQVGFIEANNVNATKSYRYRANGFSSSDEPQSAEVVIRFDGASGNGTDVPLPAGVVRVYTRDAGGSPKFIGENRIDHTPSGSSVGVQIGEAFDVTVQPTLVSNEKAGSKRRRYTMEYLVRNAGNKEVAVDIEQPAGWRDSSVVSESIKGSRIDAYRWRWSVPVKANDETRLSFVLEAKQ